MYNHFINLYIDAQTAAVCHYGAIAGIEKQLFGKSATPAGRVQTTGEIMAELRRVYGRLTTRVVERARLQFANDGQRPAINLLTTAKLAGFDIERSLSLGEVPDFDRLWATLEARFGLAVAAADHAS